MLFFTSCLKKEIKADIVIENGKVYNGIDSIAVQNTIAIKGDTIIFIGDSQKVNIISKNRINASGLIVAPGFIDPHTHADRDLVSKENSHNQPFIFQGITTVIVGNDGSSFYPLSNFKEICKKNGIGTNVVPLIGHGTIRKQVMGTSDKKVSSKDILNMQSLLEKEMQEGAFGFSTGLFYAPGSYAETKEVVELAKITAKYGGIYDTHLRDESTYNIGLIPAIQEAITIGKQAKIPVHISHIKCLGVGVWKQSDSIINLIEYERARGIEITANQYPYDASATGMKSALIPRWAESGGIDSLFIRYNNPLLKKRILSETQRNIAVRGGADKLLIVKSKEPKYINKNLMQIANYLKVPPQKAVFEILKTGYVRVASFNMNSYDIENFMRQSWVVTGSDGNTGHPRKYGTFPRKYRKYVVNKKIITLAQFINNSTSKTADIFRIKNRGRLKQGYYADIIIFDPKKFNERANYKNAFLLSEGLKYSIINGKIIINTGKFTNILNGKVLNKFSSK